jgi:hypothetical protein
VGLIIDVYRQPVSVQRSESSLGKLIRFENAPIDYERLSSTAVTSANPTSYFDNAAFLKLLQVAKLAKPPHKD